MKNKFKVVIGNVDDLSSTTMIDFDFHRFNCGEHNVKIDPSLAIKLGSKSVVSIYADIKDGDIMQLAILKDALDKLFVTKPFYQLYIPYLPYARQDRVMVKGESFSLKVFCNFINSMNFDLVVVDDCHSDVGVALLNNCQNINQSIIGVEGLDANNYDAIVSPDGGALKKVYKVASEAGVEDVIQASKHRNVSTGELSNPQVLGDVNGKTLLIVDDLCEGGFTFMQLAKVLKEKGAKQVDLYVTHGVFSKGRNIEFIDNVYCKYDWTV
ncbi:putative phosphoribosylpyrophosphate synthetase [Aeromonas phage ZPAH1]|nr:putative phosphoribosylpyrophosphate synthetase [Aeromonas phage ZPAH1]